MSLIVDDGSLIGKDPEAIRVYTWDYDDNLGSTVTIVSSNWFITAVDPSTSDTALTKDSEAVLAGQRSTQVRLTGGTLYQTYQITNRITTNESPSQSLDKSVILLIRTE